MSEDKKVAAHVDDIAVAVERAIERLDARDKAEQAHEKKKADEKEQLSQIVSIVALALTMLMSFLAFARSERDDAGKDLRLQASRAEREIDARWALYQNRSTERAGYQRAEDQLTLESTTLPEGDPRTRLAELNHVEYSSHIAALDNENRHVFFAIQSMETKYTQTLRAAVHIDDKTARYDMGTRVLTLALVVLSVALLANQRRLLYAAVLISFAGAAIAVSGYFMP